jgi:hypothetical protein
MRVAEKLDWKGLRYAYGINNLYILKTTIHVQCFSFQDLCQILQVTLTGGLVCVCV